MKHAPSSVLLFEKAQQRGYTPEWLTDYGMFEFTVDGKKLFAYQTKNFGNNQFCSWLTSDKHATHVFLDRHNIPTIPYCYSTQKSVVNKFFDTYHPIVAKPVMGEKSEGVILIADKNTLLDHDLSSTLFEQYIQGIEYRYLFIRNELKAVQKKMLTPTADHPWQKEYSNLLPDEYDSDLVTLAKQIHTLIPQQLLAIDFIVGKDNKARVLEVNSAPGLWSFLHPDHGEAIDLTDAVLDVIIDWQRE